MSLIQGSCYRPKFHSGCYDYRRMIVLSVDCVLSDWTKWTDCSATCGPDGYQSRNRSVLVEEECGGLSCSENRFEVRQCNQICLNGGVFVEECECPLGWKGLCCTEGRYIVNVSRFRGSKN